MKKTKSIADILQKLDNEIGVSGYESRVAAVIREELEGFYDSFYEDALGNNIFIKNGTQDGFKIMLCAHMDEIGYIVSHIEESGQLRFLPVGCHDDRMAINQDVVIQSGKGLIYGIIGAKPLHITGIEERKVVTPITELFIDIATGSKQESEDLGIRIGDIVSYSRKGFILNGTSTYTGKAVDNRSSCAVMVEVMKQLKNESVSPSVYAVASVQEEMGMRGAGTAANAIQPDIALALDVTLSGGIPGISQKDAPIMLGKGASIKFYDFTMSGRGNAVPKKLTDKLVEIAEKNSIPYQREVIFGGATDGWAISLSGNGVLTGAVSIPSRYMHSAVGAVNINDMENAVKLIVAFIKDLNRKI